MTKLLSSDIFFRHHDILAKIRSRMKTIITFSRQNDPVSRKRTTYYWENFFSRSGPHLNLKVYILILISEATGVSKHVFYACLVLSCYDFLVKSFVACMDNQAWLPTLVCPLNVVMLSQLQRILLWNLNTGECQQQVSVL